jgi:hypothetical protein
MEWTGVFGNIKLEHAVIRLISVRDEEGLPNNDFASASVSPKKISILLCREWGVANDAFIERARTLEKHYFDRTPKKSF